MSSRAALAHPYTPAHRALPCLSARGETQQRLKQSVRKARIKSALACQVKGLFQCLTVFCENKNKNKFKMPIPCPSQSEPHPWHRGLCLYPNWRQFQSWCWGSTACTQQRWQLGGNRKKQFSPVHGRPWEPALGCALGWLGIFRPDLGIFHPRAAPALSQLSSHSPFLHGGFFFWLGDCFSHPDRKSSKGQTLSRQTEGRKEACRQRVRITYTW